MDETRVGFSPQADRQASEPSSRDLIEGAVRKIVTAVVIAGGVIALGIYSRPGPPRYQAFAAEGRIVRIDTRSGTVIACEGRECMTVVRKGQELRRDLPSTRREQGPQPAPALRAPTPDTTPAGR